MKKVMFVCTGNYYRSIFCENLWNYLSEKHNIDSLATSSGFKPELASLWKDAFGEISPFTIKMLKILDVPLNNDSSLKKISQERVDSADHIVILNEKEHSKYIFESKIDFGKKSMSMWKAEDVDSEFPLESLSMMISNVCTEFQKINKINTFLDKSVLRERMFSRLTVFKQYKSHKMSNI